MTLVVIPLMKAGPLRNGAERGHGKIYHAVAHDTDREVWETATRAGKALCGQQPAIQWSSWQADEITCPRCKFLLLRENAARGLLGLPPWEVQPVKQP